MLNFLKKQWEQIAGNVKYGALVFIGGLLITGFGVVTHGLKWWQQAVVVGTFSVILIWATVATFFLFRRRNESHPEPKVTATPGPTKMLDSDPRLYLLNVVDAGDTFSPETRFVVENRGGAVAHQINIKPIQLGFRKVNFGTLDNVAVNDRVELLPWIEGMTGSNQHNLFQVLDEVWEAKTKVSGVPEEIVYFPLCLRHASFDGDGFEVDVDLVYHPIKRRLWKNHRASSPQRQEPNFIDIRHSGFRRASTS